MPLLNGVPLPHEGRARYLIPNSTMVLIDLDDKHIVIEVHKDHLAELPKFDQTFTLTAGDLRFFYYLKTPDMMRFLNSMSVGMNRNCPASELNNYQKIGGTGALDPLVFDESTSMSPKQIEEVIDGIRKTGHLPDGSRSCLLCSDTCQDEVMYVGVLIAHEQYQTRLGYSKKKVAKHGRRLILYQLCPTCFECSSRNEDVEAKIKLQMSVQ